MTLTPCINPYRANERFYFTQPWKNGFLKVILIFLKVIIKTVVIIAIITIVKSSQIYMIDVSFKIAIYKINLHLSHNMFTFAPNVSHLDFQEAEYFSIQFRQEDRARFLMLSKLFSFLHQQERCKNHNLKNQQLTDQAK